MVNKILVADDNVEIIRFLKPYLIKAGFQVIEAYNGDETLLKNLEHNPRALKKQSFFSALLIYRWIFFIYVTISPHFQFCRMLLLRKKLDRSR